MASSYVLHGEVLLPTGQPLPESGDLVVVVEDVSRADAASDVVGEHRQPHIALHQGATIPFVIEVPASQIDDRHVYAVRAQIHVSGTAEVSRGDLISTQSHPVLTRGYGTHVQVPLRRI
jgi:uncharacterized lipoprotein YbaY